MVPLDLIAQKLPKTKSVLYVSHKFICNSDKIKFIQKMLQYKKILLSLPFSKFCFGKILSCNWSRCLQPTAWESHDLTLFDGGGGGGGDFCSVRLHRLSKLGKSTSGRLATVLKRFMVISSRIKSS